MGGELQIEESFTDLAAALIFFDGSALSITLARAFDVEVSMRSSMAGSMDRFGFEFALLAVPELLHRVSAQSTDVRFSPR